VSVRDLLSGLPPVDYAGRRERVLSRIGDGVMVLASAPELVRGRDGEVRYRPDPALYYLTGFEEPSAVAVLTPHDPGHRLTLFVRPRDPEREAWDGPRSGPEGAMAAFGADAAYPISELSARLRSLLEPADAIWYSLGAEPAMDATMVELVRGFRRGRPRAATGPSALRDPAVVLDPLRRVKDAGEVSRLRAAAAATIAGHRAGMAASRPGAGEWEIEAAVDAAFRSTHPTAAPAFQTIVGSGPNAAVLHYRANRRMVGPNDLVLLDAGAEVEMYCGDVTRTFPASGSFTMAQRELYEVVLRAERAAIEAVRPGARFVELHDAARRALTQGMVQLGLLQGDVDALIEREAYRRFYMHQTSHWIGLEVHDVGDYRDTPEESTVLQPGMVLTIEPGLYLAEGVDGVPTELIGCGVRIEDDVLVTETGHEVLTAALPAEPDAVEAMVGAAAAESWR
jgi:Xaa-Pro aminopeptidase